jgi:hypothetical protein
MTVQERVEEALAHIGVRASLDAAAPGLASATARGALRADAPKPLFVDPGHAA